MQPLKVSARQCGRFHSGHQVGRSTSTLRSRPLYARRGPKSDQPDVRLDGEEEYQPEKQSKAQGFVPSLAATALGAFNLASVKLTDAAMYVAPPDTSVVVVERCVKAGLILGLLAIVKSFLSVILTLGTLVLASYVATKVFGVQVSSRPDTYESESRRSSSNSSSRSRGSSKLPRRRDTKQGDVIDVWYD